MACQADLFAEKVSRDQVVANKDFADELICKLCHVNVVGCDPKLTKCSHLFCGDCLERSFASSTGKYAWLRAGNGRGYHPCPECGTNLNMDDDIFPVDKHAGGSSGFLWRMLNTMQVECRKPGDGGAVFCQWVGDYGGYWEHVNCGGCVGKADGDHLKGISRRVSLDSVCSEGRTTPPLSSRLDSSTDDDEELWLEHEAPKDSAEPVAGIQDLCSLVQNLLDLKKEQPTNRHLQDQSSNPGFYIRGAMKSHNSNSPLAYGETIMAPPGLSFEDSEDERETNVSHESIESMPGMQVTSLVSLKEKEYMNKRQEHAEESAPSPRPWWNPEEIARDKLERIGHAPDKARTAKTTAPTSPAPSSLSLADSLDFGDSLARGGNSKPTQQSSQTQRVSKLAKSPAEQVQLAQWQQATRAAQLQQQASLAYAYQMAAAYHAQMQQAVRYQQTARMQGSQSI